MVTGAPGIAVSGHRLAIRARRLQRKKKMPNPLLRGTFLDDYAL
ncbi:hypothetical protein B4099_1013 [Heyndrickxia coagulans]|uniref:Uncharacterized protein n=1 Tax=Heyndrickxia coagulans TaxID=1398 RepID=A0A150K4H3_HEYCO|nr:hypothetical protein B4099_1013 [Heyndrickxia coagulans]